MGLFIKLKVKYDIAKESVGEYISKIAARLNWLYIRLVLIFSSVLLSIAGGPLHAHAKPPITLSMLAIPFIFGIVSLQFVSVIRYFDKSSEKCWTRPSWHRNPFNFSQPLQFFHFGGWWMLMTSLPTAVLTLFQVNQYTLDSLMPLFFGLGMIVGTHLSILFFKSNFENA
jgi:hypothetical protein